MGLDYALNTDVFTQEELAIIQQVLDKGQIESLMILFPSVDLSPEKEAEIAKLKGFYSKTTQGYSDADVRKKWKGQAPETPEEEANMQKDLNAHKHAWMLAHGYTAQNGLPVASTPEKAAKAVPAHADAPEATTGEDKPKRKYTKRIDKVVA